MARPPASTVTAALDRSARVRRGLQELEMFFQGKGQVHKTLRRIVKLLEKAHIPYVVVGGLALNAHRYHRATTDVDILLTSEGLEELRAKFLQKKFDPSPRRTRRFVDRVNGVTVDILITGQFPGFGKDAPFPFPHPEEATEVIDDVCYVNLATLVALKLAARRWRDFADVIELIRHNELDETFSERIHSAVRQDYIECLEEKRREDEYELNG